ncbi:MAG: glucosaminidase domain-containing protein [Patescibacteria group bacterium]
MLRIFKKSPVGVAQFLSVGLFIVLIPFSGKPTTKTQYETRIKLDTNNAQLLTLPEKKVEVYSAGSREDLNNLDPEAIKGLMQAIAPEYGVDWKMVYAIGYHESGNYGSSLARNQNNFFGRKASSGGYASWSTPEEGIRNEFVYLKTRYLDKGLTTPAAINVVYAEDMSWHFAVESVMASL